MLTRKNFEAVAAILRDIEDDSSAIKFRILVGLADYFEGDNPNFDRQRFIRASYNTNKEVSA